MTNLNIATDILENDFADIIYAFQIVQSPEQLLKTKFGNCFEQTELARHLFTQKNIPHKTYLINNNCGKPGEPWLDSDPHTFLVFQDGNRFYWFEHTWDINAGIHGYDSMKNLFEYVRQKSKESYESIHGKEFKDFRIWEYTKPELPMRRKDFLDHCMFHDQPSHHKCKEIKIEDL